MKAAHEGVPVAGLPLGTWRSAEAQGPDAAPSPPLDLTGLQPASGGRGGRAPQPAPPAQTFTPQPRAIARRGALGSATDGAPLPPADIPNPGHGPPARDKGLLDKQLGTL